MTFLSASLFTCAPHAHIPQEQEHTYTHVCTHMHSRILWLWSFYPCEPYFILYPMARIAAGNLLAKFRPGIGSKGMQNTRFNKKIKNKIKSTQSQIKQHVFFSLLAHSQEFQIGFPEPRISLNEMHCARKAFKTSSP